MIMDQPAAPDVRCSAVVFFIAMLVPFLRFPVIYPLAVFMVITCSHWP
jgi:hypothetical protein